MKVLAAAALALFTAGPGAVTASAVEVQPQEEGFPQQVAALATSNAIVDLSKPLEFDDAISSSLGSLEINDMASSDSYIRAVMVLEGGKVVSSYTRDDVDPNVPFDVKSVLKGLITLLIGMLIDEGKLTLETILGDVFTDPSVWEGMEDAELRQNISILEMITMTSGLTYDIEASFDFLNKITRGEDVSQYTDGNPMEYFGGGGSLVDALSNSLTPMVEENRGVYNYVVVNNILSYVILEVSGLTPFPYLAENILPALGIENDDLWWQHMTNGVEDAFSGIRLTVGQMAKFGQLYLQRGATGSGNQLVSEDWIDDSLSVFVEGSGVLGPVKGGYLWFERSSYSPGTWCADGAGGQLICVNSLVDRVVVTQRDDTVYVPGEEIPFDDLDPAEVYGAAPLLVEIGMNRDFSIGTAKKGTGSMRGRIAIR
mmetsp:Transcript_17641/g.26035  ORF Transcript_17641/g.26035 Transcript_17641/m.26035 type:complete len:427 (-) Transcript_17641:126-1406(-)